MLEHGRQGIDQQTGELIVPDTVVASLASGQSPDVTPSMFVDSLEGDTYFRGLGKEDMDALDRSLASISKDPQAAAQRYAELLAKNRTSL